MGLIPARAGNTDAVLPLTSYLRAHPRSRGEHLTMPSTAGVASGSSPLARGTPSHRLRRGFPCGLIPARAGNTLRGLGYAAVRRAHPRSRGEH